MNIKYHFIASCLLLSGGLAILTGCNSPQSLKEFTVKNPLDINREDEALVLTRAQLNPTDKLLKPVITNGQGEYIPCQLDDLDGDGEWDELAFVYTFSPSEKTRLKVEWLTPEKYPVFAPRTNVRYGKMTSPGIIEELSRDAHDRFAGMGYSPASHADLVGTVGICYSCFSVFHLQNVVIFSRDNAVFAVVF